MGYLHEGDVDFYRVNLGTTPPGQAPSGIFSGVYNGSDNGSYVSRLQVTSQTSNSVSLTWESVSGAYQYRIEYANNSSFSSAQTTTTSSTSYTVSSLSSGVTYYFRVKALNSSYTVIETTQAVSATTSSSSSQAISLTQSSWYSNTISSGQTHTYQFYASSYTTYHIEWNDSYSGDGTKTGDVKVSAKDSSGSSLFTGEDSGYGSSYRKSVYVYSSGYITITVAPFSSSSSGGTYAIKYY
jgi:hypothetical protein